MVDQRGNIDRARQHGWGGFGVGGTASWERLERFHAAANVPDFGPSRPPPLGLARVSTMAGFYIRRFWGYSVARRRVAGLRGFGLRRRAIGLRR